MHLRQLYAPWKILFFGSDKFSLEHLICLHKNGNKTGRRIVKSLEICVSSNNKNAVYEYGTANKLKMHVWPPTLTSQQFDVGVVVSFGHLIPQNLISMFPYGILNVHPSLLPQWRGATPIQHSVLNGEQEFGITIMHIQANKFDIGPCIVQQKFPAPSNCYTSQMQEYLATEGSLMLLKVLSQLSQMVMQRKNQISKEVLCAHKIQNMNKVLYVDWESQSADQVYTQYQTFGCETGLLSKWNDQSIRLFNIVPPLELQELLVSESNSNIINLEEVSGKVFYLKKHAVLCIQCLDCPIGFREVVFKKQMSALSFYNGYLTKDNCYFTSLQNDLIKYSYRIQTD